MGSTGVDMSLSVNQVANPVVQMAAVSAPNAPHGAQTKPSTPGVQAVQAALPAKPAVEVEPLVDQEQIRENLQSAIEKLNEQVERNGRGLNFAMDERLNRPVITVRNTASGEIVRQIPNEVVIKVAHSIEDIKGLLMDQML
jgi:flagellar protein FlaG